VPFNILNRNRILILFVGLQKLKNMRFAILTTCCLFILIAAQSQSFQPTSALTVFSEDGKPFYLILNGERQNSKPETNLRIEDLVQPYYNAKIIFDDKTIGEISKNALMLQDINKVPQDVTYKIKADKKGKQVLRYFSSIPVTPDMPRSTPMQNVSVYSFGMHEPQVSTTTRTTTVRSSNMGSLSGNAGIQVNGMGMNININAPDYVETEVTTTTTHERNDYRENEQSYGEPTSGCQGFPMRPADFQAALKSVKSSSFDETRLSTAKSIASSNCLNVNQIIELCKTMSFEESKLDFAKYAHIYCVDANNYFKVNTIFSFESSKTELNEVISGR